MIFDSLGDRMKTAYEDPWRIVLPRRVPIIVRVDGKSFHTLTRDMAKPFDDNLMRAMDAAAISLCEEIQGARVAYVQSDEISVLIHGYRTIQTQPWLDNNLQKICSLTAAIATDAFGWWYPDRHPLFDSRAFLMPEDEVCNYFIWRQQDATRNSINMLAQHNFSAKELHGLSCDQMQERLWQECNLNWNDLAIRLKRGRCALRHTFDRDNVVRHEWRMDNEIPIFTQQRDYVESLLTKD